MKILDKIFELITPASDYVGGLDDKERASLLAIFTANGEVSMTLDGYDNDVVGALATIIIRDARFAELLHSAMQIARLASEARKNTSTIKS